jgi:hypothetical protein
MTDKVGLVNAAIRLLRGTVISSLTDGTANANVAADLFDVVRDDLLRAHNWNFATMRAKLARSSTVPAFEFDYGYALPSDWIRTVSVHDNDAGTGTVNFREEFLNDQNVILASVENLYLRYIARIEDTNRWPADFNKAFIHAMARDMAIPIVNSNTLKEEQKIDAEKALRKAKGSDAMGSSPERRPSGSWATSRSGWRR